MLRHDLFPILYPNLISIAGIWDAFDEGQLLEKVETSRVANPDWAKGLADSAAWLTVGRMIGAGEGEIAMQAIALLLGA